MGGWCGEVGGFWGLKLGMLSGGEGVILLGGGGMWFWKGDWGVDIDGDWIERMRMGVWGGGNKLLEGLSGGCVGGRGGCVVFGWGGWWGVVVLLVGCWDMIWGNLGGVCYGWNCGEVVR
uniref:Uncharacterized protein n=1 Tax=Knipowitschia caucasica TaxID=637954 RepID=A0AAV2KDT8_KNICA